METRAPDAILVLRVWFDGEPPGAMKARLVEVSSGPATDRVVATATSVDDVCERVRAWAAELTAR